MSHHPLGPSTLKHVEICPSYRSPNETNPIAEEGTLLHEACETGVLHNLDENQQALAAICLNYVDTLKDRHCKTHLEKKLTINLFEKDELHYSVNSKYSQIFGTGDVIICHEKRRHIDLADYKFGYGEIDDAEINIQGQAYMLGAMDIFDWAETCTVHFIQPRRDEVTTHTYSRDDLKSVRFRLRVVVERATAPEPATNAHTETCRFCANRISCVALRDNLLPIARKEIANDFAVDLLKKYSPSQVSDPDVLSKMLEVAPVMEKWAQEAKKHAAKVAQETGEEIPGYRLAYRSSPKKVGDAQEAFEALKDELTPEAFARGCKVSLVELTKSLADHKGTTQAAARALLESTLIEAGILEAEDDEVQKNPYMRKK